MTKQRNQLDPYSAPTSFRAYIYDSVILKWETAGAAAATDDKFNSKRLEKTLNVKLMAFRKLQEIQMSEDRQDPDGEFLYFYYSSPANQSLFKTLRNTFAHGHYRIGKRRWIVLKHKFKGPRDKHEMVRLYGQMSIAKIKQLISALAPVGEVG